MTTIHLPRECRQCGDAFVPEDPDDFISGCCPECYDEIVEDNSLAALYDPWHLCDIGMCDHSACMEAS